MLVNQVQGVPGELGATTGVTANQKRVLVTYLFHIVSRAEFHLPFFFCHLSIISCIDGEELKDMAKRTGDLPDQVVGDVCLSGHCDGILDWNRRDYRGDSRSRIGAE